ncbi:isopenicillin N synthase family oxygenase [Pseudomonas aeruginosa]|nr:isopenicillin N synthase family oxygenase [Pseudomonas aeruginosa]MCS8527054.1 isopenicillin N synthase family oxygenase [Pseudomonas aeruginosa]HBP5479300.1 isopenicillin N synthase family oxygenase [Pseudomonas aeruginosa]
MIIYTPASAAKFIPVIDLTGSFSEDFADKKAVAWEIHKACRETGFFYIKNHGIPEGMIQTQLECARQFFSLPQEDKIKLNVAHSPSMRGYEPMAIQALDDGSRPDFKEGFMAGIDGLQAYTTNGEFNSLNQWPKSNPEIRVQVEAYIQAMTGLGKHLLGMLALSLELPEGYFSDGLDNPMITTRLLHYPPQPRVGDGNQIGAGAHTDWGMITMLLQDDVGGLEVRNADGEWIRAPHIPNTFIINLGDMVPVLTRGIYRSNMHRVLNLNPERHRYSVPTFFDPSYHYRIKPLTHFEGAQEFSQEERTVGEHIAKMYAKTYGDPAAKTA